MNKRKKPSRLRAAPKKPRKRGRPRFEPDIEVLKKLLALQCNDEQIGAWFEQTERTIKNLKKREPYKTLFASYKERGKTMIKMVMFDEAVNQRNTALLIWLSKTICGMKETSRLEHSDPDGKALAPQVQVYLPDNGRDTK